MDNLIDGGHVTTEASKTNGKSKIGLLVGGLFGAAGVVTMALATPFVLPALRKHCLPYIPATDVQLQNLSKAFKSHAKRGGSLLDVGSGDGRICRLGASLKMFPQVHGVELNYILVLYSRFMTMKSGDYKNVRFFHQDLWHFPINKYDTVCIFGVESMMGPLEKFIKESNTKPQTIVACRFPFPNLTLQEEIGKGIDTVWVYKLTSQIK